MNFIFVCLLVLLYVVNWTDSLNAPRLSDDGKLNFTALGAKYGQVVEEHEVTTEDGYILRLFRIPGKGKKPILLMHGLTDSADSFIIRGKKSIVIALTDAGYDVWLGNMRGNKYSRRHLTLNPDEDAKFWDYSFHEGGYYDLPAMIDYILHTTGERKLQTIGHSQGTTMHFVLLSKRPEYNEKIKIFVALAPAAFMSHVAEPWPSLAKFSQTALRYFKTRGVEEWFPENSTFMSVLRAMCSRYNIGTEFCYRAIVGPLLGSDRKRFERIFLKSVVQYAPTSASMKCIEHFAQMILSKRFCEFDYGDTENLKRYSYMVPPDYNVRAISAKIALMAGRNDPLCRSKDFEILRSLLPNVVSYQILKPKEWTHIDFVVANDLPETLFPYLLKLLEKYE